jgi:hypothetical protein
MSPDHHEVLAALAFPEARLAYYTDLADDAEQELLARQVEEGERCLGRREAGEQYARQLGLPPRLAPAVAIMIYGESRAARQRACDLILRHVQRAAREAA